MNDFSGVLDPDLESLESVIRAMEELEELLEQEDFDSMKPFLQAYLKITREVKKEKQRGGFDHPKALEKLDIRFAQLYFNAVRKYIKEGEKKSPWNTYFNYIERDDSRPLIELVLGINAHINSDLAQALHETGYSHTEDFKKVDEILLRSLFPVLARVASERRDLETMGFITVPPAALAGLNRITTWRSFTLQNSRNRVFNIEKVRRATEQNAETIIKLRHDKRPLQVLKKPLQAAETAVKL